MEKDDRIWRKRRLYTIYIFRIHVQFLFFFSLYRTSIYNRVSPYSTRWYTIVILSHVIRQNTAIYNHLRLYTTDSVSLVLDFSNVNLHHINTNTKLNPKTKSWFLNISTTMWEMILSHQTISFHFLMRNFSTNIKKRQLF